MPPYGLNYDQLAREQTPYLTAIYDHNQHFSRSKAANNYHHYFDGCVKEKNLPKIRIVDESKLKDTSYDFCKPAFKMTNAKPKISFSIESIIGIH